MIFKVRYFRELISQMQILKVGAPIVGFKFFAQEEALGFEFPSNIDCCCRAGVYDNTVTTGVT